MFLFVACEWSRPTKDLLPQQTLMELLVENMKGCKSFKDLDGELLDIDKWGGLTKDLDGVINAIDFGPKLTCFGDSHDFDLCDGGTIDLQWIPDTTKKLFIGYLSLEGTIETTQLPSKITVIDISDNKFCGTFDMASIPAPIEKIEISENQFSGSLHISVALPVLVRLDAQRNLFSGSLDFSSLPPKIQWLYLSTNRFSGSINLSQLPDSLSMLDISDNDISQERLFVGTVGQKLQLQGRLKIDEKKSRSMTDILGSDLFMLDQ